MPSTWARDFAVAIPTRIPVKSPGPSPTAIPPRADGSRSAHRSSSAMVGTAASWPVPVPARSADATRPCSVPRATVVRRVEVSMPRTSTGSGLPPRGRRRLEPPPTVAPGGAAPGQREQPEVAVGGHGHGDLEMLRREQGPDGVAPFDEHHAVLVEHLLEAEVEHVLDPIEPVDVQMVDGTLAPVLADQGEGRGQDGIADPERPSRSLHQRGLPRPQVAGE